MKKEKIAIGFDLGTTSVGWSIVKIGEKQEDLTILDMGVRLFDDPARDANVETRREARGRRRRINRQRLRKSELCNLLIEYKIVKDRDQFENYIEKPIYNENEQRYYLPLDLKILGLSQELQKNELTLILHNYIKHRGTLLTIDNDEEDNKDIDKTKLEYDSNLFPCENQLNWYKKYGKVLGNVENSLITNEQYQKEIRKILSNQKVSDDFIEKFINLFKRHREYWQGPGSKNSFTPYGRFVDKNGKLEWMGDEANLWDKLIGKCTYYPEEDRNYKKSPITEIFNLMNDFANMVIKKDDNIFYLNKEQKQKILNTCEAKNLTLDKMLKSIDLNKKDIFKGLKGIEENKPVIEPLETSREILEWANNVVGLKLTLLNDLELIHQIFALGVKWQNSIDRFDNLKKEFKDIDALKNVDEEKIRMLSENKKIWKSKTSSLSKKAQMQFIKFALSDEGTSKKTAKNQMYFFNEMDFGKNNLFEKYKYFPTDFFKDEIMPLTVKRTFNQATKVLNEIMKNKKYANYQISNIVIEMARELNSSKEKKEMDKEMKANKERLKKLITRHNERYNIDESKFLKGENKLKFLLWCEQGMCDVYDGQYIDPNHLLSDPNAYDIDHIIPISISFNNSIANKVLTKHTNNLSKGNKTPYHWLSSQGKYKEYEERVIKTYNDIVSRMEEKDNSKSAKKLKSKYKNKMDNYLLYVNDPIEDLNGFINRQLNDTRYISRLLLNNLQQFFKYSKEYKDKKVTINVVNGGLTNFARNTYFNEKKCGNGERFLMKKREIYNHHAIDASIICFLGINKKIETMLKFKSQNYSIVKDNDKKMWVNNETGETFCNGDDIFKSINEYSYNYLIQMRDFINPEIKNKNVKFSRMLLTKNNIALSGETLFSIKKYKKDGKEIQYKISKLNLLNEKIKYKDLCKYFGNDASDKECVLCYIYDYQLYDKLNKIFIEYIDGEKNPFINYMNSEFIRKELEEKNIGNDKLLLIDENNKHKRVLHLRIRDKNELRNKDELFTLKNHNHNAFYDGLNWVSILVFKNDENKLVPFYLNAKNCKFEKSYKNNKVINKMVCDSEALEIFMNKNNITNNKYIEIKRGTTLIKDNYIFYVSGGSSADKTIEIKSLIADNEIAVEIFPFLGKRKSQTKKTDKSKLQIRKTVNSLKKDEFKLCQVDALGNVYNIKSFDEFFEK